MNRQQLFTFMAAVTCVAAASSIFDSTFNNFLSDTFKLTAQGRGLLELPRELPGFLVVVMTGLLAMLPVTRLGMIGACGVVAGMLGMAAVGRHFGGMLTMMILTSSGLHLLMPVSSTIGLTASHASRRGRRMGQIGMLETLGVILGSGFVWLTYNRAAPVYWRGFLCGAALASAGALAYCLLRLPHLHQPRTRLVVRRKFWLYYLLEFFFGARKQIFLTFGPWVLIKVYGLPASSIAGLMLTAAVIGLGFKPLVGWAIDRFGERRVLVANGLVLTVVCLGYGYAQWVTKDPVLARRLACVCLVADNLLFALETGRAIYVSRVAESAQELTSTLSLGISINHIVSMTIPIVAGSIWLWLGYESLFLAAAVLALGIAALSSLVPPRRPETATYDSGNGPEIQQPKQVFVAK